MAKNPDALKANAKWAKSTATIIVYVDAFSEALLQKAGFKTDDPVADLHIEDRNIIWAPITSLTKESLADSGLDPKSILRSKNMFTLGMCFYLFNRPLDYTYAYLEKKFGKKVSRMHLYYTRSESESPYISWDYAQQSVQKTMQTFDEIVEKIEARKFSNDGVRKCAQLCDNCDLRHYCHFK